MKASLPYISLHSFFKITVGGMFKLVRWPGGKSVFCIVSLQGLPLFLRGWGG